MRNCSPLQAGHAYALLTGKAYSQLGTQLKGGRDPSGAAILADWYMDGTLVTGWKWTTQRWKLLRNVKLAGF